MDRFTEFLENEDLLVKHVTLIVGIILLLVILIFPADALVKDFITTGRKRRLTIYLFILGVWIGFWLYKRHILPKSEKGKLGIIISLTTENDKGRIRLKNDFVKRLKELLDSNQLNDLIAIRLLENHQAERVNPILADLKKCVNVGTTRKVVLATDIEKRMAKIQQKLQGVFYVWGSIIERDGDTHFLETDCMVFHGPIEAKAQEMVANDITSIWNLKYRIKEQVEYEGFRLSAELTYLGAKYIIGSAAFAAKNYEIALRLHQSLENEIAIIHGRPNLRAIKTRLNGLLAAEYSTAAYMEYLQQKDWAKIKDYLEKCLYIEPNNLNALTLKANMEFSFERNPEQALRTTNKLAKLSGKNGTWRYSQGFLLMYLEQFTKAMRIYEQIAQYTYKDEEGILPDIYDFNVERLKSEPKKIQSLFILGYLKFRKDSNYPEALRYFEEFINKARGDATYRILLQEAESCKKKIERSMGLTS